MLNRKQLFTINFQSCNFKEFRYTHTSIEEQKYKIECQIQKLIVFEPYTFEENSLFSADFIIIEKEELKNKHRKVEEQLFMIRFVSSCALLQWSLCVCVFVCTWGWALFFFQD